MATAIATSTNKALSSILTAAAATTPYDAASMPPVLDAQGFPVLRKGNGAFTITDGSDSPGTRVGGQTNRVTMVIAHTSPVFGRMWYTQAYDPNKKGTLPACWSSNGVEPDNKAASPQSKTCATCTKNIKGSAANGQAKACASTLGLLALVMDPKFTGFARFSLGGGDYYADMADQELAPEGFMSPHDVYKLCASSQASPAGLAIEMAFDRSGAHPSKPAWRIAAVAPPEAIMACSEITDEAKRRAVTLGFSAPKAEAAPVGARPRTIDAQAAPAPASDVEEMEEVVEEAPAPRVTMPKPAPRAVAKPSAPAAKTVTLAPAPTGIAALAARLAAARTTKAAPAAETDDV